MAPGAARSREGHEFRVIPRRQAEAAVVEIARDPGLFRRLSFSRDEATKFHEI